jgi:hypothetical protein
MQPYLKNFSEGDVVASGTALQAYGLAVVISRYNQTLA